MAVSDTEKENVKALVAEVGSGRRVWDRGTYDALFVLVKKWAGAAAISSDDGELSDPELLLVGLPRSFLKENPDVYSEMCDLLSTAIDEELDG